jgi:hypothetical protein
LENNCKAGKEQLSSKTTVKLENSSKVEEKQQGKKRRTVKLENNSKAGEKQ